MRKLAVLFMAAALLLSFGAVANATITISGNVYGGVPDTCGYLEGVVIEVDGWCGDGSIVIDEDTLTDINGDYTIIFTGCAVATDTCTLTVTATDATLGDSYTVWLYPVICGDVIGNMDFCMSSVLNGHGDLWLFASSGCGYGLGGAAGGGTAPVIRGETRDCVLRVGPVNSTSDTATVCVTWEHTTNIEGAVYTDVDHAWDCVTLPPGGYWSPGRIGAAIPCTSTVGAIDTFTFYADYCYADTCGIAGDCCFPQWWFNLYVQVMPSPPAIAVLCPDTAYAEAGVNPINVPFEILNPDPCVDTTCYTYDWTATSGEAGLAGSGSGQVWIAPGGGARIFVQLNGTLALPGTTSTICMIASTPCDTPYSVSDTCCVFLTIVEPFGEVPLFSTPVAAILILSLVLMAAGFMRRRAVA